MTVTDLKQKAPRMSEDRAPANALQIVPNLITLAAMAAGLTSIQYAINLQWGPAVVAILVAIVLDGLDGATARILHASSDFGAQLDNLSDFLSFGIAPSVIMYVWALRESGKFGWMATLIYAAATALRLARFSVEQKDLPNWKRRFFTGVPSPAGAGLVLFPLVLWIQYPVFFRQFASEAFLIGAWLTLIAALMISRIPTFSLKMLHIPPKLALPVLGAATLLMAALINFPWETLTAIGAAYIVSLPIAYLRFHKLEKNNQPENLVNFAKEN